MIHKHFSAKTRLITALIAFVVQITFADVKERFQNTSIEALISETLEQNPELKFYEAEVDAAKGIRTQAGLWKNPEISGQYGDKKTRSGDGTENRGEVIGLSAAQTFEFPGKGSLRKAIANKNVEIAELGLEQFRLALIGKVKQLSYQYIIADKLSSVAESIVNRSDSQIALLKKRPAAGVQGLLDIRIIESSVLESKNALIEAEQLKQEALTELNTLRGKPASQPVQVQLDLSIPIIRIHREELIMNGFTYNLLLKTRNLELARSKRQVNAAWLDAAPDFSVGPFYSKENAGDKETSFGISVSLPLPFWNWNQGNIQTADAKEAQARALYQMSEREIEREIVRRLFAYNLSRKQLENINDDYLQQVKEAADLADRHYRLGGINVQTFLEMQRQQLSVSRSYLQLLSRTHESFLDLELLTAGHLESLRTK